METTKPRFLDRLEAALYLKNQGLKTSAKTLQKLATVGGGPAYQRYGHRAVYTVESLDAWVAERLTPPSHTAIRKAA